MKNIFKNLLRKPFYLYFSIMLSPYILAQFVLMMFGIPFVRAFFMAGIFYLLMAIICLLPLFEAAIEAGIEDGFDSAFERRFGIKNDKGMRK